MVTKENRAAFITIMTATTSLSGVLMAIIAWIVPYWRHFLRVIYAPCLLFLLYIFLLDESIRWLLITGRKNEAKNIIREATKMNKVDITEAEIDNISYVKRTEGDIGLLKVLKVTFSSRKLVARIGGCVCMWIVTLFNKYVLILNSVELEGNKYINYGLTQISELPASFLLVFILNKFKRRIPLTVSFLLTGVFCGARAFVPKGHIVLSTFLFLVGKFMAAISSAIVYLYTAELFPTQTRSTMHSLCSSIGRTATILAPQTPLLMRYWYGLPSLLVGVLSLVTGLLVLMMPDTAEDVLPDTVFEAENVGSKETNKDIEVTKF
ncbi:unnamed protein product [Arctia plantaginis]|nr:unnamed protein product [Arctia plantaginis]